MRNLIFLLVILNISIQSENIRLCGTVESGFLAVLDHKIQLSKSGTYFDYDDEGGQNNLFAVRRFALDLYLNRKHSLTLLYQPLSLVTREVLRRDVSVDSMLYPKGTGMRFQYDFPYYRLSYLYNIAKNPDNILAFGISMQIRNATIAFESLDGTRLRTEQDIGPVPILKFRWKYSLNKNFWVGSDMDGFYAPISYLNGSDTEVTGAILDASLQGGLNVSEISSVFLNLRYLGGGAVGESQEENDLGDGYVKNWLHFLTVTVGFSYFFRS
jgi:hypothetical protein